MPKRLPLGVVIHAGDIRGMSNDFCCSCEVIMCVFVHAWVMGEKRGSACRYDCTFLVGAGLYWCHFYCPISTVKALKAMQSVDTNHGNSPWNCVVLFIAKSWSEFWANLCQHCREISLLNSEHFINIHEYNYYAVYCQLIYKHLIVSI